MALPSQMRVLSLCTGVGGLELGVKLAVPESRIIAVVEREAYACAVLVSRMQEGLLDEAPIWTDARTFDGKPWCGVVDCITGGYPCQPFSKAGRRLGESDPRHLWPSITRIIDEAQPSLCFFENVANHLRMGFEQVNADLRAMGYRVASGLFSAEEVGASHQRERLFILAYSKRGSFQRWRDLGIVESAETAPAGQTSQQQWVRDANIDSRADMARGFDLQASPGVVGETNRTLAHTVSERPQGEQPAGAAERSTFGGGRMPLFPPGPRKLDEWSRVLSEYPGLAPALSETEAKSTVCGMANGMAHRVDRIRACGNGVVPLVAAYAFCTLFSSLRES